MPELYVVAGPNGVGKTTLFKELIPFGTDYINADLIARTLRKMEDGKLIFQAAKCFPWIEAVLSSPVSKPQHPLSIEQVRALYKRLKKE